MELFCGVYPCLSELSSMMLVYLTCSRSSCKMSQTINEWMHLASHNPNPSRHCRQFQTGRSVFTHVSPMCKRVPCQKPNMWKWSPGPLSKYIDSSHPWGQVQILPLSFPDPSGLSSLCVSWASTSIVFGKKDVIYACRLSARILKRRW